MVDFVVVSCIFFLFVLVFVLNDFVTVSATIFFFFVNIINCCSAKCELIQYIQQYVCRDRFRHTAFMTRTIVSHLAEREQQIFLMCIQFFFFFVIFVFIFSLSFHLSSRIVAIKCIDYGIGLANK